MMIDVRADSNTSFHFMLICTTLQLFFCAAHSVDGVLSSFEPI